MLDKAKEEILRCLNAEDHNVSTETLELCLEALRIANENKHNGFSNYPTWYLCSYIDNDFHLYVKFGNCYFDDYYRNPDHNKNISAVAKAIEDHFSKECMEWQLKCNETIWAPILNHVEKDLINYREIAEALVESYDNEGLAEAFGYRP